MTIETGNLKHQTFGSAVSGPVGLPPRTAHRLGPSKKNIAYTIYTADLNTFAPSHHYCCAVRVEHGENGAIWMIGEKGQIGVCPVTSVANFIFGYTAWVYILTKI